jgi:hypothetical protein
VTKSADIPDKDGRRVAQLFEDVLATLPAGAATLETRRTHDDRATIITLKPSNKKSSAVSVHMEDGGKFVDVSLGELTTLEFPWEAHLPKDPSFDLVLEEMKKICLAVIAGHCEHRFGFLGIRGTIRVGGEVYRCTHFFYPRLCPKTVRYEPYLPADRK